MDARRKLLAYDAMAAHVTVLDEELAAARLRIRVLEASLAEAEDWPGGLDNGVGRGVHSLADHLAQAWLVISKAEDGDGRSNRYYPELPGYVDEDWSKMVARRIQGYARLHPRPIHFPWEAREFDQFDWLVRVVVDAGPPRPELPSAPPPPA